MYKKHIRLASIIISIALVATSMVACGNSKTESENTVNSQSSKNIKLTFWHTYGDGEEEQLKNVVLAKWNELHPEIEIEVVRQDSGQYNQMIVTAFGTGQSPDVARIDIVDTASYAKQGGIIALDDMDGFTELKDSCLNAPLSTNLYQGKHYGLPLDTNCKAAVINQNTMKKLGFDEVPATMEEIISATEKNGDGKFLLNTSGVGEWDMYPYFWLFGGTLSDDGFTKTSGYLDSDESIASINKLLELNEKKIFTIRDVDGTVDAWDGIQTGEYAMFFEGPWFFSSYEDTASQGIIPALIPTYNGRSASVVGGENIAIFESCKNKDAAYEFVKFMISEETQLSMLEKGQLPVLKSLVNNSTVQENPVWAVYMEQMDSALARIPSPNHTQISQIWSDTITNIFVNKADVKTELTNAAKLIDEQLAG